MMGSQSMTEDDLKKLIKSAVDAAVAPLALQISRLKIENNDLATELQDAKTNSAFTLRPNDLANLGAAIASNVSSAPRGKVEANPPEKFEGKPEQVDPFLSKAALYLDLKSSSFATEKQKIQWLLTFFTGKAEAWGTAKSAEVLAGSGYILYSELEDDIRSSFSNVSRQEDARTKLGSMKLSSKENLSAFVNRFRPEADASGFGDDILIHFLRRALTPDIQMQVASIKNGTIPTKIAEWYQVCNLIDSIKATSEQISRSANTNTHSSLGKRQSESASPSPSTSAPQQQRPKDPDAMDVDGHRNRRSKVKCYNCEELGHYARDCTKPSKHFLRMMEAVEKAVGEAVDKRLPAKKEDFPGSQQ